MSRRRKTTAKNEAKLQMTSMIDVVFLLLAFFVITYKTPEVEGDFNIRMPVDAQSNSVPELDDLTPVVVKLSADARGELVGVRFGDAKVKDMATLRAMVFDYIKTSDGSLQDAIASGGTPTVRDDLEIELDCDPQLRYQYAMQAITAVTGYLNSQDQLVKLVDKVKFSPPK